MPEQPSDGIQWSVWITRLIGLWLLVGAAFKLLWGTPEQLPSVLGHLPIDIGVTYRVVIAAETCIALLALLRPRWSWLLLIAMLLMFDGLLVYQVVQGEASCGCFGAKFPVAPIVMLGIDSVLLLLLLFSRPWATPGSDATGGLIAIVVVLGAAMLPWVFNRQVRDPSEMGTTLGPAYVVYRVDSWKGKPLVDTDLAPWIKLADMPETALWVFYRDSCPVCADLLAWLAEIEAGGRAIVLVHLPEESGEAGPKHVHRVPDQVWVTRIDLPEKPPVSLTVPAAMWVKQGKVVWSASALHGVDAFQEHDALSDD